MVQTSINDILLLLVDVVVVGPTLNEQSISIPIPIQHKSKQTGSFDYWLCILSCFVVSFRCRLIMSVVSLAYHKYIIFQTTLLWFGSTSYDRAIPMWRLFDPRRWNRMLLVVYIIVICRLCCHRLCCDHGGASWRRW